MEEKTPNMSKNKIGEKTKVRKGGLIDSYSEGMTGSPTHARNGPFILKGSFGMV